MIYRLLINTCLLEGSINGQFATCVNTLSGYKPEWTEQEAELKAKG
jgi:hypothetical protein